MACLLLVQYGQQFQNCGFKKNHLNTDLVNQSALDPRDFLFHLYGVGQVII